MTPLDPDRRKRAALEKFPVPRGLRATTVRGPEGEYLVLSRPVDGPRLPTSLSDAEADVARRVVAGETNEQIAANRGTSARTVANQIASIFRKLGVASRTELVAMLYDGRR